MTPARPLFGFCMMCLGACASAVPPLVETASDTDLPEPDITYLHWDKWHGYQVGYYTAEHVWLWYPGNRRALRGSWVQETVGGIGYICFTYPSSSHNPVTAVAGGQKECQPRSVFRAGLSSAQTGDVFNLSSGDVPYVLDKTNPPTGF